MLHFNPLLLGYVVAWYAGCSLATYIAYFFDKRAAHRGRWRTPENSLHLLALCGGWPGAFIAQRRLRHKTRKVAFLVTFWLTVVLNCSALGLWYSGYLV